VRPPSFPPDDAQLIVEDQRLRFACAGVNAAAAVAWVQVTPSVDDQTSFFMLVVSYPPITHILPLNTTAVCSARALKAAAAVAWFQVMPSLDDQTSL